MNYQMASLKEGSCAGWQEMRMNKLRQSIKGAWVQSPEHELSPESIEGPFWEPEDIPTTKDKALNQETFRNRNPRLHSQKLVSAFPAPFILSSP